MEVELSKETCVPSGEKILEKHEIKKIRSRKKKPKQQMPTGLLEGVEKRSDLSEGTPLVILDSQSGVADSRSDLDHEKAQSCAEVGLLPLIKSVKSRKRKPKQQMPTDVEEQVEKRCDYSEGTPLDSQAIVADTRSGLDTENAQSCGEVGLLPPIKKIKSRKRKPKQQVATGLLEGVENLSEGTPLVVDSKSVVAGPRSDLDHEKKESCGEVGLLPPIKRVKSRKRKPKQQMLTDVEERVEKGSDYSEGTPLDIVDIQAVVADPRSGLDTENAQSCGEVGLLPPIKKIKSRKRKPKQQVATGLLEGVENLSEGTPLVVDSKSVVADPRSDLDHEKKESCGEVGLLPPIKRVKSRKRKPKQQMLTDVEERVEKGSDYSEGTPLDIVDIQAVVADTRSGLDTENAQSCGEVGLLPPIKKIKSRKRKPKQQVATGLLEGVEKQSDLSEGTPLVVDSKSAVADTRSGLDTENAQSCGEVGLLPPMKRMRSRKKKAKPQVAMSLLEGVEKQSDLSEGSPLVVVDSKSVVADTRSDLDREKGQSCGEVGLLPPVKKIRSRKRKPKQQMPTDVDGRVEKGSDYSEGTPLVIVDSQSVVADTRSDLDTENAQSCGEVGLLPPMKRMRSRKKKAKQQVATDLLDGVEKQIDLSEGTPLVVDSKSVLADPRSDLDHEKKESCGEVGLPPIERIRSRKRKLKQQMTTGVNPTCSNISEETTTVVKQEQNMTEVVNPDCSNSLAEASLSGLQDSNLSRKQRKRKRKELLQHSANLVNPETSNMSAEGPTSVLQELNGNTVPSNESNCLLLSKDDLLDDKEDMLQHLPNSLSRISTPTVPKKKLLILDLNGLLADIVPHTNERRKHDFVLSKKYVYRRPHVDDFIDFCLEMFTVAVWSSRKRRNIGPLVKFLVGTERSRKFLFCWDQYHCTKTSFKTIDESNKPLVLKDLSKVWENQFGDPKWQKGEYNESNTLLLDDSPYKALINPANTAIFPESYCYSQVDDNSLGPGGDLRLYLESLSLADNVQEFVRNYPFGKPPITESDPSWHFYQKVLVKYGHNRDAIRQIQNDAGERRNGASNSYWRNASELQNGARDNAGRGWNTRRRFHTHPKRERGC